MTNFILDSHRRMKQYIFVKSESYEDMLIYPISEFDAGCHKSIIIIA